MASTPRSATRRSPPTRRAITTPRPEWRKRLPAG
jgi:hypothetical protein